MIEKVFGIQEESLNYTERDAAYLLAINDHFLFPVVQTPNGYFLIGGGIERQETPEQCLVREVKEEVGAEIQMFDKLCKSITYYRLPNEVGNWRSENYFIYCKIINFDYVPKEKDHSLKWLTLEECKHLLTLEHQRWAVNCFFNIASSSKETDLTSIDSWNFIQALKKGDLAMLRKIPKSDLHNHAPFGGSREIFHQLTNWSVDKLNERFDSFEDMIKWCDSQISRPFDSKEGFLFRVQAAFMQATFDGITKLSLNFGVCAVKYFTSPKDMVDSIEKLRIIYSPNIQFLPELCLDRSKYSDEYVQNYYKFLDLDYFKSIDMTGNESIAIDLFKPLFDAAKHRGLILKAHVGEFADAQTVITTASVLQLDQIQHGISISDSEYAMAWIRDHKIQLNICPSSNYYLRRVPSISFHPIALLYHSGIKVTVNSDDIIIFGNSVSEEFLTLYQNKVLSAEELNQIRIYGLL